MNSAKLKCECGFERTFFGLKPQGVNDHKCHYCKKMMKLISSHEDVKTEEVEEKPKKRKGCK